MLTAVVLHEDDRTQEQIAAQLKDHGIAVVYFSGSQHGAVDMAERLNADLIVTARGEQSLPVGVLESLRPRELEVLRLIALGKSQYQIADTLRISYYTVKRHCENIYERIGLRGINSDVRASVLAAQAGLV